MPTLAEDCAVSILRMRAELSNDPEAELEQWAVEVDALSELLEDDEWAHVERILALHEAVN